MTSALSLKPPLICQLLTCQSAPLAPYSVMPFPVGIILPCVQSLCTLPVGRLAHTRFQPSVQHTLGREKHGAVTTHKTVIIIFAVFIFSTVSFFLTVRNSVEHKGSTNEVKDTVWSNILQLYKISSDLINHSNSKYVN